jgi:hypothetical protein
VDVLAMWVRVWFWRRRLAEQRQLSDRERRRWERFYRQYRRTWHWRRLCRKVLRRATLGWDASGSTISNSSAAAATCVSIDGETLGHCRIVTTGPRGATESTHA